MAVIRWRRDAERDADVLADPADEEIAGEFGQCSFCGERNSVAAWSGQQLVTTCFDCAQTILPRLIADAFVGEKYRRPGVKSWDVVPQVGSEFYRACAIALEKYFTNPVHESPQVSNNTESYPEENPPST